jgi:hypothetical protein
LQASFLTIDRPLRLGPFLKALRTLGFLIYMGGYVALLVWFKHIDFYHTHFTTKGFLVAAYNFFRVLFIFYLFWIVYAAGAVALRWADGKFNSLQTMERLVLGFFAGAGLWYIVLLALGYLKLYTPPVAIAVTLPAVALTYPDARDALSEFRRRIPPWRSVTWQKRLTVAAIAFVGGLLLLIKGLYPGGGHDYYTHYFHYYQEVIQQGGIWPNKVWYHYFYSKGSGLFFLGILLTDPLAPQLVTFCFMAAAAATFYLIVSDVAPRTNWPLACVLLFVGTYVFTPGWGEFEKDHEFNTALILGIIWMLQRVFDPQTKSATKFIVTCGSAVAAATIINTQTGVYLGAVFALTALVFFTERRNAFVCVTLAAWAGILVTGTMILNYLTAGLPVDQGIGWIWPFANVEKLYATGSLPMLIELYRTTNTSLVAQTLPLISLSTYKLLVQSFRLDLFYPLAIPAVIVATVSIIEKRQSGKWSAPIFADAPRRALIIVCACAFVALLICLTIGRTQPISFHRYSTFTVPIVILMCVILWTLAADHKTWLLKVATNRWIPVVVVACCLVTIAEATQPTRHRDIGPLAFVAGAKSIDDAYVSRGRWPYHLPWGAIYPATRSVYAIAGPHTPVWSLHLHSYCMLPDCQMEGFISFKMADRWDRVMFGTAEEARQVLQRAGINYFFYSRELAAPGLGINDPLPLSTLFSPEHIADHFALRWTDGTSSLLTWPGPDTRPLDDAWLAGYRQDVNNSRKVRNFPLAEVRGVYERYYQMPHPWKPIPLPW